MSANQEQIDEREVLLSIYEGDARFKAISPTTYQYKYGEDNDHRSFLVEISWPDAYPTENPTINLDTFYNKHLAAEVKSHIVKELEKECEPLVGEAMTYTLFEWVKEHEEELMALQPEQSLSVAEITDDLDDASLGTDTAKKEKKEQLTKAQKRRQWNKMDYKGEKARGWDWVDIVKHLSQTGSKADQDDSTA